ncbi:MAG TPA: hypothetical protein VL286_00715 [Rhizomicrobium sp.]|jgi:hypothetical protein|nr:hypothetical protein [Rhizomicrobium sp.]
MNPIRQLMGGAAVCALAAASAALLATPASADNILGLKVYKEVHHDTSLPLRDMIRIYNEQHANEAPVKPHVIPLLQGPATMKLPAVQDGIKRNGMAPNPVPTTDLINFDGIDDAHSFCNCAPPDTNGAVGATQYVQWVNAAFAIYNKTTGALISGPTAGNALWSGFSGRCAGSNSGDPIAQYDKVAGRWVMMQPVFSSPYKMCFAVSTTSDATGTYNRYEFDFGSVFPDYPKLGVWPAVGNAAYLLAIRNFLNGSQFKGAELCAVDRTNMLLGNAATMQCNQLSTSFDGVVPGDFDGLILPPAAEDALFVNHTGSTTVNFWKMHVDFANPNNTTVTQVPVTVPSYSQAASVPQKGTTQKLDALPGFTMYRLAYRNFGDHEAFVTNHSVSVNTRAAVRWYEFRNPSNPTLFQSGNIKNKTLHFWMGSIAMDKAGNIAAGFSTSSANDFPGISYAGRTPGLAAGKMQKHAGGNTTNGGGSQTGGLSRWGDYSAMSVDPIDDCTMYYTTEYLKTSGSFNWSTKINSFKFNSCT